MSTILKKRCCCKAEGEPCSCCPVGATPSATVSVDCTGGEDADCTDMIVGVYDYEACSTAANPSIPGENFFDFDCYWSFRQAFGQDSAYVVLCYDINEGQWYAGVAFCISPATVQFYNEADWRYAPEYSGLTNVSPITGITCSAGGALSGTFELPGVAVNPVANGCGRTGSDCTPCTATVSVSS